MYSVKMQEFRSYFNQQEFILEKTDVYKIVYLKP